ncbi:putative short chain oxidoreductase/dehydrogenase [Poronia punctata]|nr:putative short chain oxidoreductase/dehydrogenase [Poronia punctata]
MVQTQVWLITGASRGIGFETAKAALKAGHKVIACYRAKPADTAKWDELEALGGIWTQLDPSSEEAETRTTAVVSEHGQVDVLVNNAAYGMLATIEDTPLEEVKAIFNTNFIGTLRTIKAMLPSMRERKAGTIVNISSSIAQEPYPLLGIYAATKSALEAYTESLQGELSPFGIRALIIEPGMTATDFSSLAGSGITVPLSAPYQGTTLSQFAEVLSSGAPFQAGASPIAVAERIVETVDGTGLMAGRDVSLRLPLGKDAGAGIEKRAALLAGLQDLKDVWNSV